MPGAGSRHPQVAVEHWRPQTTLGWASEDMSSDLVLCCVVCVTEEEASWGAWAFLFTL